MLCLQIAKLENLERKRFIVGTFGNTRYSMLGLGKVKNVVVKKYLRQFGSKTPLLFPS